MHLTRISRLGAAAAATVLAGSLAVALPSAVGAAEPPALLTGLITDAATGQPVPGACVDLEHPTYLTLVARACAGSDGQYTVPGKAASANMNVLTRAYADGYLDAWAVRRERYQSPVAVLKASGAAVRNFKLGREAGELRGTFVDREGGPMGLVSIFIYLESATTVSPVAATRTAPDGTWSVRTVPPGSYRIETDRGASVMGAGPFVVTAGGSTVADVSSSSSGQFSPSKELNGTVRDTGGESVPGARVALWYPGYGEHVSVLTDAAGAYRFPRVTSSFLDSYKIVVTAPGYGATWSGDRPHPESALRVQNLPTTNDFTLRKDAGTVSGRLVDGAGEPVVTTVQLRQSNGWLHTAYTMADGTYRFPNVRPDEVTLNYATTGPKQWAARKLSEAEADRYPVAAGATVTVDNQLYGPTGTLEVRLVDASTGELLPKSCAVPSGIPQQCVPGGIQRFEGLLPGPRAVTGRAWPVAADATGSVVVNPDGVTVMTLRLQPLTHAEFRVARDADGTAPGFCVRLVAVYGTPQPASLNPICNYSSGTAPGDGILTTVPAGRFQALVEPQDTTRHGRQWLGTAGGTGRRAEAAVLDFRAGKGAAPPVIKLDGAGSIRGRIDSMFPSTAPRCVRYAPKIVAGDQGCAAPGSEYELTGLGPYAWELQISDGSAAPAWSGGAPDRSGATGVAVTAGQVTRFDHTLRVDDSRIQVTAAAPVTAYSAISGDELGTVQAGSLMLMPGLPSGPVYLYYDGDLDCWYGGSARTAATLDRAHRVGGAVNLPVAGVVRVEIKPGVNCFATRPPQLWNPAGRVARLDLQLRLTDAVAAAAAAVTRPAVAAAGRRASGR